MLDQFEAHTTLPAADLERAKAWYKDKLGLTPKEEDMGGAYYETGGSKWALFPTQHAGTAKNTQMEWSVKDIRGVVDELKKNGVKFDTFEMEGIEWDGEIAVMGGAFKGAWFKDSEENTLALTEAP